MNPSSSGWIKKLLKIVSSSDTFFNDSEDLFYIALRDVGFIYGSNISVVKSLVESKELSADEICKINLFLALTYTHEKSESTLDSVESIIDFYTQINAHKTSIFQDILGGKKSSSQLEKIIHKRVQINDNIITKNFDYFVINALLFVDVLAYQEYLNTNSITSDYIKNLENAIETISFNVLNSKVNKTKYDNSLIKLFESSLRYQDNEKTTYTEAISYLKTYLEKCYLIDIACMATWGDKVIDIDEVNFLKQLGNDLNINALFVIDSINKVNNFYTTNKDNIALLSSKNIVQSFYDNSSKMVAKLIYRNGKRLKRELKQSKELMILLTQSTVRELTPEEQKRTQEQLLDVFKSIPSLAIFMLPGGALLLPLFVKIIPKLLPSAFDDNRIEDD